MTQNIQFTNIHIKFFFIILLFGVGFLSASSSTHNSMDRTMQIARNQYLRIYVSKKTKLAVTTSKADRFKEYMRRMKERTNERATKIYNSVASKCHDAQIMYYSLSPDNRELIEQLINLHF
jgi:hypothetical protein